MSYSYAIQAFLFIAFFLGSFLSITLVISRRHRSLPNYFLAIFLAIYAFKLLLNTDFYPPIGFGNYLVVILLLTPTLYLYTYTLTHTVKTFRAHFLWHYIPAIFVIPVLFVFRQYWDIRNDANVFAIHEALITFSLIQGFVVIHAVTYILLVIRKLLEYKQIISNSFSNLDKINLHWLTNLCYGFLIVTLIWVLGGYGDIGYFILKWGEPPMIVAYIFWFFMSSIVLLIGYSGFTTPEIFLNNEADLTSKPLPVKKYPEEQLQKISEELTRLMHDDKPFLNPTLKLSQLAEAMNTNPGVLSAVINTVFKKNFNDFINEYRVKEVIVKMNNPELDKLTLLALALDSGFNSKSTFNATFKKVTGKTPNNYKKEL